MSHLRHSRLIRSAVALLTGLAGVAFSAIAAPAALAMRLPPGGATRPLSPVAPARTLVAGGMPGWQIAAIALGAALAAAVAAVLLDRARTARRRPLIAA
jgi:hypothetical protein